MSARSSLALVAALALTACTGGGVVAYQDPSNSANVDEIRAALSGHVTALTIVHNPFPGMTDRQVAEIVASETPTSYFSRTQLTTDPAQATAGIYHLVWDFGTDNGSAGDGGCGNAPAASTPASVASPDVHGSISLCRGSGPMTRAYGYVNQVSGPQDPKFVSFVSHMTTEILLYPMPAGGAGGGNSPK